MRVWLVLIAAALPAAAVTLDEALALLRGGQAIEAETALRVVVTEHPDDLSARYWLAVALAKNGRQEEAVEQYLRILAEKPESVGSWVALAQVYERLQFPDEALAAYRRAHALQPGNRELAAAIRRLERAAAAPPELTEPSHPVQPPTGVISGSPGALGHFVGIGSEGVRMPFNNLIRQAGLDAVGEQVLDYTFASAPTDWQPVSGTWQVTNRFACDPTWSFFGGASRGLAAIWNKREFVGDLTVEAYVSFRHGLPYNPQQWSYRPADICLTLFGDGVDPASGYSFIYSGNEGRTTMIRRGDEVLAATDDPRYVAPSYTDTRPDTEAFHRRWWRLEARRIGDRLEFWVDGAKALEVELDEPVDSGRVAIWTVRNGISVARVRISYAAMRLPDAPPVRVATPTPLPAGDGAVALAP